jgi:hypothetical protein
MEKPLKLCYLSPERKLPVLLGIQSCCKDRFVLKQRQKSSLTNIFLPPLI